MTWDEVTQTLRDMHVTTLDIAKCHYDDSSIKGFSIPTAISKWQAIADDDTMCNTCAIAFYHIIVDEQGIVQCTMKRDATNDDDELSHFESYTHTAESLYGPDDEPLMQSWCIYCHRVWNGSEWD